MLESPWTGLGRAEGIAQIMVCKLLFFFMSPASSTSISIRLCERNAVKWMRRILTSNQKNTCFGKKHTKTNAHKILNTLQTQWRLKVQVFFGTVQLKDINYGSISPCFTWNYFNAM